MPVGAATVGIAWSEYLNNLLVNVLHTNPIPYSLCHSPFQTSLSGEHGMINLPAFFIVAVISLLLIKGTQESAFVNGLIVVTKVAIVIMIIIRKECFHRFNVGSEICHRFVEQCWFSRVISH